MLNWIKSSVIFSLRFSLNLFKKILETEALRDYGCQKLNFDMFFFSRKEANLSHFHKYQYIFIS